MQSISKSWGKGVTSVQRARNIIAPEKSKKKKRNRKLSKSTWSGPATGIIVLWFAHLFSIVHLGSPSMTYRTINSKGFVPDCEQIYFRHRYRRKHTWASEKIPFFFFFFFYPTVPSAAPSPHGWLIGFIPSTAYSNNDRFSQMRECVSDVRSRRCSATL